MDIRLCVYCKDSTIVKKIQKYNYIQDDAPNVDVLEQFVWCVHGPFLSVKFGDICQELKRFIESGGNKNNNNNQQQSKEVIILRIKQERDWRNKDDYGNPINKWQIIAIMKKYGISKYVAIDGDDDDNDKVLPKQNNINSNRSSYHDIKGSELMRMTVSQISVEYKRNIILFFNITLDDECKLFPTWRKTCHELPKQLILRSRKWIELCVNQNEINLDKYKQLEMMKNEDNHYNCNYDGGDNVDNKTFYLLSGQITANPKNVKYLLHQLVSGCYGTKWDVEFVNYQVLNNISDEEYFRVNVWDMDFLHPKIVQRIIEANLRFLKHTYTKQFKLQVNSKTPDHDIQSTM